MELSIDRTVLVKQGRKRPAFWLWDLIRSIRIVWPGYYKLTLSIYATGSFLEPRSEEEAKPDHGYWQKLVGLGLLSFSGLRTIRLATRPLRAAAITGEYVYEFCEYHGLNTRRDEIWSSATTKDPKPTSTLYDRGHNLYSYRHLCFSTINVKKDFLLKIGFPTLIFATSPFVEFEDREGAVSDVCYNSLLTLQREI